MVHSSFEILSFLFLGLFTLTGYVKLKNRRMLIVLLVFGRRFSFPLQIRNYSGLDQGSIQYFTMKMQRINGHKMKKDCFARNVLQKSSGFLTSINTFVIKKQGIHTEWGVFDEMESMLLIYDAFQKGSKFLQAQKCRVGLLCRGEDGVWTLAFLLQV